MPSINSAGLNLIMTFEGCELAAYQDSNGVLTIGYGHTGPDVHSGETITAVQAETLLAADLRRFEDCVQANAGREYTKNQFAALVSFAYNVGPNAYEDSTLLRLVNVGDDTGAAAQFGRWVDSPPLLGLVRRRAAERALFLTPDDAPVPPIEA